MKFINCTPHTLHIYRELTDENGKPTGETEIASTLDPSGVLPRVSEKSIYCWTHNETGIDAYRSEYGGVVGLPDKEDGIYLIVSAMVRNALPDRSDLCSPGRLLRDPDGKPIGSIGVYINKQ